MVFVQRRPSATHAEDLSTLDPYETWTFDSFYQEDGLVMDSSVLTPLAYEYVLAVLPESGQRTVGSRRKEDSHVHGEIHNGFDLSQVRLNSSTHNTD